MKFTKVITLQWKKRGCVMISMFVSFFLGLSIYNSNSSRYATKVLRKWSDLANTSSFMELLKADEKYVVPNIVHFIWFAKNDQREMSFLNFISIYSSHKVQQPDIIMFHCNHLPSGHWWNELWKKVPLRLMHREPPKTIHGQAIMHLYHQGDVTKFEILLEHGGIYLDYDVVVVNKLDPLRLYDAVLGKKKGAKLNAGVIIASKNSLFFQLLKESYKNNYRPLDWDYNCASVAYQIAVQRPDLIHIEPFRLTTPDWSDRHLLWKEVIDWSGLYVIHVMAHFDWFRHSPESIKRQNSTFGQVMRYIYYNSSQLVSIG